jgi:hypothetical protein
VQNCEKILKLIAVVSSNSKELKDLMLQVESEIIEESAKRKIDSEKWIVSSLVQNPSENDRQIFEKMRFLIAARLVCDLIAIRDLHK